VKGSCWRPKMPERAARNDWNMLLVKRYEVPAQKDSLADTDSLSTRFLCDGKIIDWCKNQHGAMMTACILPRTLPHRLLGLGSETRFIRSLMSFCYLLKLSPHLCKPPLMLTRGIYWYSLAKRTVSGKLCCGSHFYSEAA